ncbi:AbiJ-NTD4 domain-containing protein [Cyclobacterium salsum]|uniref:AbiJ-NTD4 domain-containing protein n=1 Tax=Cyclobacterium salsum TaxID=2666329 RepID=UPI001390B7A0|nr:hypothetical protein [Cyclobacterium salsum]
MRFSSRNNYSPKEVPITTREEAPPELQEFIIQTAYDFNFGPAGLRKIVCRLLRKSPNRNNWTEFPNIDGEVHDLLGQCEWFYVYDLIEELYECIGKLLKHPSQKSDEQFAEEINQFFRTNGIGWQLRDGKIEYRGDDDFEALRENAVKALENANKETSKYEIKEAINDLSKKPNPDITGSIQHSLAALECVIREVTGDTKSTLGKLINDYPDIVPKPIDTVIAKLWGYTSNVGRHIEEENPPDYDEAELAVGASSIIISYLAKKNFQDKKENSDLGW